MVKRVLAWAQRNERHLGAIVFVWGFITDIIAFVLLDISIVNIVFAAYLALAALAIFLGHLLSAHSPASPSVRSRASAARCAITDWKSLVRVPYLLHQELRARRLLAVPRAAGGYLHRERMVPEV